MPPLSLPSPHVLKIAAAVCFDLAVVLPLVDAYPGRLNLTALGLLLATLALLP